jgi:hypothetical protein
MPALHHAQLSAEWLSSECLTEQCRPCRLQCLLPHLRPQNQLRIRLKHFYRIALVEVPDNDGNDDSNDDRATQSIITITWLTKDVITAAELF